MAIRNLTGANFEKTVEKGIVLVDWWASWCGPCRAFTPIYEAGSARHPEVVFGKIDTEAEPMLAAEFAIRAIPTLMAFRDGILVFVQAGMLSGDALDDLVAQVTGLDMEAVQRQVLEAERQRAAESQ